MDPISLILAALAAGATAALKDTAGEAVKDAYSGLKALLKRRFMGDAAAQSKLAEVEQSSADVADLKPHPEAAGAQGDEELLRAARQLLDRVDPEGARRGKYDIKVSGGQGVVIGDNASVTMTFDD